MPPIKRLLSDPLTHFLALGALLFILYSVAEPAYDAATEISGEISINQNDITEMERDFYRAKQRMPTREEIHAMIEDNIKQEVLYREAIAQGFHLTTPSIRADLARIMKYAPTQNIHDEEPDESILRTMFEREKEAYSRRPRISLRHVFLGKNVDEATLKAAWEIAKNSNHIGDFSDVIADKELITFLQMATPDIVDNTFGIGLFDELATQERNQWVGPIKTKLGMHLFYINTFLDGKEASYEEARDAVLREWQDQEAIRIQKESYDKLRKKYHITVAGEER